MILQVSKTGKRLGKEKASSAISRPNETKPEVWALARVLCADFWKKLNLGNMKNKPIKKNPSITTIFQK